MPLGLDDVGRPWNNTRGSLQGRTRPLSSESEISVDWEIWPWDFDGYGLFAAVAVIHATAMVRGDAPLTG
jgi:hypothetical protein